MLVSNSASEVSLFINLQPTILHNENLVVDLGQSITCRNDNPTQRRDVVRLKRGTFSGRLSNFTGTVEYYGNRHPIPLTTETADAVVGGVMEPWRLKLLLTPVDAAGGIKINSGEMIGTFVLHQTGSNLVGGGNIRVVDFTWNIYSQNAVIIPTGSCDVSARDITVNLPEYSSINAKQSIPLMVHCARNQNLHFVLSGTTAAGSNGMIFTNTASSSVAARGMGIQFFHNNTPISANSDVPLGTVGTSPVDIGLAVNYERTGGPVVAGQVQSIVGVTFKYD
ncbi:fimbrial protein [Enterobacteriaceae bacterium ESL0689]|nr:fimbrial protein [Enterobacteriaceae bacterium ESL0689]